MADVTFKHGNPVNVDYTPSAGDIALGQVVVIGAPSTGLIAGVASHSIPNNVLGALDGGGGVYEGVNLNNAVDGARVYWDDSANKFTTVSTNNAFFGAVVKDGGGGANTTCQVLHEPV